MLFCKKLLIFNYIIVLGVLWKEKKPKMQYNRIKRKRAPPTTFEHSVTPTIY